ncbi:MAG: hypothetical protein Q9167_004670 [Letrouitia subvulpina]
MSFGISIGDIILSIQLAAKVVQNSRKACSEHAELTREAEVLHTILRRLEHEARKPESPINRDDGSCKKELLVITHRCGEILSILGEILEKYNSLSDRERSVRRLWQKIRFGNDRVVNLKDLRLQITHYTVLLSVQLNMVSVASIGRVQQKMDETGGDLKHIQTAIDNVSARLVAKGGHDGSNLTNYTNDDKEFWRELRRELVKEDVRSSLILKHKKTIVASIRELGKREILDDPDTGPIAERADSLLKWSGQFKQNIMVSSSSGRCGRGKSADLSMESNLAVDETDTYLQLTRDFDGLSGTEYFQTESSQYLICESQSSLDEFSVDRLSAKTILWLPPEREVFGFPGVGGTFFQCPDGIHYVIRGKHLSLWLEFFQKAADLLLRCVPPSSAALTRVMKGAADDSIVTWIYNDLLTLRVISEEFMVIITGLTSCLSLNSRKILSEERCQYQPTDSFTGAAYLQCPFWTSYLRQVPSLCCLFLQEAVDQKETFGNKLFSNENILALFKSMYDLLRDIGIEFDKVISRLSCWFNNTSGQAILKSEWCQFEFPCSPPRLGREICNYSPPGLEDIGKARSIYFTQVFELELRCLYFLHETPSDTQTKERECSLLRKEIKSHLSQFDELRTTKRECVWKDLVSITHGANCMLESIDKANRHPKYLLGRLYRLI